MGGFGRDSWCGPSSWIDVRHILFPRNGDQADCLFEIAGSYFRAASPTSIERNIYSVHVPIDAQSMAVERPNALTDTSVPSYYAASFSPNAGFYLLTYDGPDVPYQKLIKVGNECVSNPETLVPVFSSLTPPSSSERAIVGRQQGAERDGSDVRITQCRPFHY